MGCSSSVVPALTETADQDKAGSELSRQHDKQRVSWSDPVRLTDIQKRMVAKSIYNLRPNLSDLGLRVYRTVFTRRPDLKAPFGFHHKRDDELEYDLEFRGHAARFMAVVGCAIESIHKNDGKTDSLFRKVGAHHLNVSGFKKSNFGVFKDALLDCMAEQMGGKDKFKGELYAAWDAVIRYIIQRLQEGYAQAKAELGDSSDLNDTSQDQDPGTDAQNPLPETSTSDACIGHGSQDSTPAHPVIETTGERHGNGLHPPKDVKFNV